MIHDWKMEIYWRLPVRLQEAALSLFSRHLDKVYYSSAYAEWREWLMGWKSWSQSFIKDWESQQLQYIVKIAGKQVPYYRNKWRDINWNTINSISDLHLLPTIHKQSVRMNENSFLVDGKDPKSLWIEKTSGTTGTSLKIYWPRSMVAKYYAFEEVTVRYAMGVSKDMARAMVGGRPIVRGSTKHPPYWRYNRNWRQLYMSSYHISRKTAAEYIEALRKYGSLWMLGYGSAIAALAESAIGAGIESYPLLNIMVSGDTLLPRMRLSIEKYFQCKCFDSYGLCEGVALAQECAHGRLHVTPMFGIIEILRDDDTACKPGEVGEIVGTSLLNDAMPLIRYRTGDYAAWSKETSCPCGDENPVISDLEGRVDDYLITSDGMRIGRLSPAMKRSQTIHSAQLVQDRPGHAFLLVRPGAGFDCIHAKAVKDDILERIGKFSIEIIEVDEIPKTPQGKTKLVIRLKDIPIMNETYENILRQNSY